ncbi:MAG: VOC family protein [Paracoccaceae bacterium]
MNQHGKMNYVEFHARDLVATKAFFTTVFGWEFTDYGPEYTSFSNQGLDGGFFQSDLVSIAEKGATLIVFYSNNLQDTQHSVEKAGGIITHPIFSFPGGERFHFTEPSGNEYAVWSDVGV